MTPFYFHHRDPPASRSRAAEKFQELNLTQAEGSRNSWFDVRFSVRCFKNNAMMPGFAAAKNIHRASIKNAFGTFLCLLCVPTTLALASSHYTTAQLDALATRVGTIYWISAVNNRTPVFLSAPVANAAPFSARDSETFEIIELIGQKAVDPYYKVKFDSGKEGYIRPEAFFEEFNLTILTVDRQAGEKKKAAQAAEEEKKRVEWIQSQPWPPAVKEAAIKRRAVPGLTPGEVKHVLGNPVRVTKIKGQRATEEHWHYADGSVLIFQNQLLNRIEMNPR